jgi:hypothetical protein
MTQKEVLVRIDWGLHKSNYIIWQTAQLNIVVALIIVHIKHVQEPYTWDYMQNEYTTNNNK